MSPERFEQIEALVKAFNQAGAPGLRSCKTGGERRRCVAAAIGVCLEEFSAYVYYLE